MLSAPTSDPNKSTVLLIVTGDNMTGRISTNPRIHTPLKGLLINHELYVQLLKVILRPICTSVKPITATENILITSHKLFTDMYTNKIC